MLLNWVRARQTAKRKADTVTLDDPDFKYDPPAPPEPDYAERQERKMRLAALWAAIAELPPGQRECIELWLGDLKYQRIASILGMTVEAVKSRIRDGKRTLHARLGADLPEDEE